MDKNSIQPNEFSDKGLASVEIPDGVISIGYDAYRNNKIESLIIPDSVKEIGFQAFAENSINNLKLSENMSVIEKSVFSNNKIKTLIIPKKVKIIERTAFQYNKISELTIPETVREIWTGAFNENIITKIVIGPHVNIIEGEYDDFGRGMTFGEFGGSFLKLYKENGFLGGIYTYNKKLAGWEFKHIPLNKNSSIKIWSDENRQYTEKTLQDLSFGTNQMTKNVSMKREDGSFGYIELKDALNNNYTVVSEDDRIEYFKSVYDLTKAGWVLD
jgi:hypothetical protein